jgi:hypothetical protein
LQIIGELQPLKLWSIKLRKNPQPPRSSARPLSACEIRAELKISTPKRFSNENW